MITITTKRKTKEYLAVVDMVISKGLTYYLESYRYDSLNCDSKQAVKDLMSAVEYVEKIMGA